MIALFVLGLIGVVLFLSADRVERAYQTATLTAVCLLAILEDSYFSPPSAPPGLVLAILRLLAGTPIECCFNANHSRIKAWN